VAMVEKQYMSDLPVVARAWARGILAAGVRLATDSVEPGARSFSPDHLLLRRMNCEWRVYLAREQQRIVFFFFKQRDPTLVFLDTSIHMQFVLRPPEDRLPPPVYERASYRVGLPEFVVRYPTQSQREQCAPTEMYTGHWILLKVGPGGVNYLGVGDPRLGAYSPGGASIRFKGEGEEIAAAAREHRQDWPAKPFLQLVDVMGEWARSAETESRRTQPPAAEIRLDDDASGPNAPWRILGHLVSAYCEAATSLIAANDGPMRVAYGLDGYRASVTLRLGSNGEIAVDPDEPNPIQLTMIATVWQQGPVPVVNVDVRPPDFLVRGELFRQMLRALATRAPAGFEGDWRDYVASVGDEAIIFRVKRGRDVDTDLFALRSQRIPPKRLILEADVKVDLSKERSVELRSRPKILFPYNGDDALVGNETVAHLLRLVVALSQWMEIVA
jgi:hypothetical protein